MQAAKIAGREHPVRDIRCSIHGATGPQLDQVGFEPTTSRVTGDVTLPFHRVQLRLPFGKFCDAILCVDNFKPGGINEHSYGADGPVIVVIEVSLLCTIPVSSAAGTLGPSVLPFAVPLSYSSFRPWRDLNPPPVVRCNSQLHHAANFPISNTPPAHAPQSVSRRPLQSLEEIRSGRNQRSRYIRDLNRSLAASADEVAVNFAIPGNTSPEVDCFGSK